jgi:uncharacterized protein (TIGR02594 family)
MSKPTWLVIAERDIGNRETLGPNDSPYIRRMWAALSGSWLLGQPWCGGAVAHWMMQTGIPYPKTYYRARDWSTWGVALARPAVGCVVTFTRQGGGHVGLVVGQDKAGNLLVLGGNQGGAVRVSAFPPERATAYRWPAGVTPPSMLPLPRLAAVEMSRSEA